MTTTQGDVRTLLDELLGLADGGLRTATADGSLAVAHAWFLGAVDAITAALVLHDNGLGHTTAPLVRAAIERTVGMKWLAAMGDDALKGLARSGQKWAGNLQRATAAANQHETMPGRTDWSPELAALIEEITNQPLPPDKVFGEWSVWDRFTAAKQFDLYVAYLSETANAHATQESARLYVADGDQRYHLLRTPMSLPDTVELRCAIIAGLAFKAMADVLQAPVWRAKVDRLEAQIVAAWVEAHNAGLLDPPADDDWTHRFDR